MIHRRLHRKVRWHLRNTGEVSSVPQMTRGRPRYELSERTRVFHSGGIGALHRLAIRSGLADAIDDGVKVLKFHKPYHESDHVLSICYNILCGGQNIEDLERLRSDLEFLRAIGSRRIPDPTTAGDFIRRFGPQDIEGLQDAVNHVRSAIWMGCGESFLKEAVIQIDGTLEDTDANCKEGMAMSYKGVMGYAPLVVSLANSREPLFIENRPGNTHSSVNAAYWIDKSVALTSPVFKKVWLRGDTAYSLTENFDRWHRQGLSFVFGYEATPPLIQRAEKHGTWRRFRRRAKYSVKTKSRTRPRNVRQQIVIDKGYKDIRLQREWIQEFTYSPRRSKCRHDYRMVVVKKDLSIERHQTCLWEEVRYFFYITNDPTLTTEEVVFFANDRCDHENDIEQLRNGVRAFSLPSNTLQANWAYMVIASLAWTLKAWMGLLLLPHRCSQGQAIIRMEFKRFLNSFVAIPAQILRKGRSIVYRFVAYMAHAPTFFAVLKRIELAL